MGSTCSIVHENKPGRGLAFSILRRVVIAASKPKAALYYHVPGDIAGQYFPIDRPRQDGLCLR